MQRRNAFKRKGRGWFATSLFTRVDVAIKTYTVAEWDDLSIQRKHELVAYVHAKATMEEWEHEINKPKKGR